MFGFDAPGELWDRYDEEWQTAKHNLAYVIMWLDPERLPFIELDPEDQHWDLIGEPFHEHIDELAFGIWARRAYSTDSPLTNGDYLEIARELNEALRLRELRRREQGRW